VSKIAEKVLRGWPGHFLCFMGVFEGCFGKSWRRTRFFDGANVVDCVVNVDKFLSLFGTENRTGVSSLFFYGGYGEDK
jgi:hypothetical protein